CSGLATSPDGLHFTKIDGEHPDGSILANGGPDEWDHWFAAWPRVLPLPGGGWRMYYHGRGNNQPSSVGIAESADGVRWEKRGLCFGPNPDPSAFDAGGVSTRHVIPWQGGYLMAYEALPKSGGPPAYRIGLATSHDGIVWERLPGPGPLGCVLDKGDADAWDALSIGTPYLVPEPDGGLRLYYVGFWREADGPRSGIGLAFADRKDITRWEKIQFA
ncbi:MAG: glycosyl hydrolase, partial [Dehalococcoidia bacterium]|nr:glycosyl hydrolase [Dehalococcoidia bacterium]